MLIVVPDGVSVRNFVYSKFLSKLENAGWTAVILHDFPEDGLQVVREGASSSQAEWIRLPTYHEGVLERVIRTAKIFAQLYRFYEDDNNWIAIRTRRSGTLQSRLSNTISKVLGWLLSNSSGAVVLEKWHGALVSRNKHLESFRALVRSIKPNLALCANQRSPLAVPVTAAGKQMNIPTATFVHSWDNLPKGRMPVQVDHYFVWSDYMADELMKYYPEVNPSRIWVVGSPQFEPYFDPSIKLSRTEFLAQLGIAPDRKIICYSGCDLYTSPYDQFYLRDIAIAVRAMEQSLRPVLLFRPVPGDDLNRYRDILAAYPEIVLSQPEWIRSERWSGIIPRRSDNQLLINVVLHADLVINLGSTVSLDFAIYNKRAFYIGYNNDRVDTAVWDIAYYYEVPHFRIVKKYQPFEWIMRRDDLLPMITRALTDVASDGGKVEQWKRELVAHPLDAACDRLLAGIADVMQQGNSERKPHEVSG